jgi:hypothetical protein
VTLSAKGAQAVNEYLRTIPPRAPTNAEAIQYMGKHRGLRPTLSAREAQWVNNLVALGKTNEANQIISEARLRSAKERMLADGYAQMFRNSVIEELILEAIEARKEKART